MKAISLRQPWAAWVAMKWKKIETRTHDRFRSLEGQRIAIHATQKIDIPQMANQHLPPMAMLQTENMARYIVMTRGRILCTAKVVRSQWLEPGRCDLMEKWTREAMCDIAGKYLLFLDEIKPLRKALPFRGRQGIFNVPDELIAEAAG